jgi:hypothetical protein
VCLTGEIFQFAGHVEITTTGDMADSQLVLNNSRMEKLFGSRHYFIASNDLIWNRLRIPNQAVLLKLTRGLQSVVLSTLSLLELSGEAPCFRLVRMMPKAQNK